MSRGRPPIRPMIKIASQASLESTNHLALISGLLDGFVSQEHRLIDFVGPTANVLTALANGKANYGCFAVCDTKTGIVAQTQEAFENYGITLHLLDHQKLAYRFSDNPFFEIVNELVGKVDHAVYGVRNIRPSEVRFVLSHPQALNAHRYFVEQYFRNARPILVPDGTSKALDDVLAGTFSEGYYDGVRDELVLHRDLAVAITSAFWDKFYRHGQPKEGSVMLLSPAALSSNLDYKVKIVLCKQKEEP